MTALPKAFFDKQLAVLTSEKLLHIKRFFILEHKVNGAPKLMAKDAQHLPHAGDGTQQVKILIVMLTRG
jgi:hypothetical protein